MTFEQMLYFQTITNSKSLNKASELLHISQPALSKQIKALEKELDVQLLIRSKQGVNLTLEGEIFLQESREIIDRVQTLKKKISEFKMKNTLIRIGALPSIATYLIPNIIKKIQSEGFMFEIQVIDTSSKIKSLLIERKIDVGFVQDIPDECDFNFPLFLENYFLVLTKSHFLAKGFSIHLNQLQNIPMILPKNPCDIRIAIDQYLKNHCIQLNNIIEVNQNDSILSLVKSNLGLTIMPKMIISSLGNNFKAMLLKENLKRRISFITYSYEIKQLIFDSMELKENLIRG